MIPYALYKNLLQNGKGYYRAQVQPIRSCGLDEVIERMVQHGSTLTKQDIMSSLTPSDCWSWKGTMWSRPWPTSVSASKGTL